ncbi:MAG TPA: peptidylprolyl isomerase [Chthoniobacterales bacterium]|jgi:peptidyl-prolyl cis-trans isomerase SurA|nr:peptidylprolyl isomerase [Chthoniobacterales bacterium]
MVKATLNFIWRYPMATLLAFSCLALANTAPTLGAESVNGIAAVVNDKVITYSEVRDVCEPRERLLRSQYSGDELVKKITDLRKAALQDLIDRQLIIQAFEKEKFAIPSHFVDERVDAIIKDNFGGDRNAFIKTMEAQKYTMSKFRDLERDKIIIQAMRSKNVKSNLLVPPAKIDEYYRQHRDQFSSKAQVKLRMIMIPGHLDSGGGAAQKSMAEEIRAKLITGADFDKMAQMYSEDSTRDLGGDWGWIDDKTLSAPLSEVAFSLKPGEISKVVDIGGNHYILKVEARQGGEAKPLKDVRADIEGRLRQEQAQQLQEHWLASLRAKAYIKTF